MFTGIIEEVGRILSISKGINSAQINIEAKKVLEDVKLGDSIAVNGVCLTVTSFKHNSFTVDVMPETMRRSSLNNLKKGSLVNLERALALGDRLGGHIVSGHIDCTGKVVNIKNEDIATWITVEVPDDALKYIVLKGSITIDGVSLTVAEVNEKSFSVSLIPHTKGETTLYEKNLGEEVNIECDLIGKYVERLVFMKQKEEKKESKITEAMLREAGFM
ncbi:riboflavin synthase subunit alpha [Clostridium carboxidivorans P7]|uniref:Riboflavin synthase n=1 Tax=Clostridium carboxidivorans P7 TaxID=536227 RepID=C6Q2S9_9CLOT|nr:riboflavin synthase [Clostridium carboxidivorans]AKN33704.1 riboflavin synthase subunit alpha [Clostridium carboxidivorans P7]EET84203.1 riboflavin synthase, alpha subunit [Clostridium carboxidivorans P7]EFG86697.1 riboflavin synthase, alpha subunit [Clostridium carboxidivorans P7]